MNDTKRCTKCGLEKPCGEFSKQSSRKDGLRSHCKSCISLHRMNNIDADRERNASWRRKNQEYIKSYRENHRERANFLRRKSRAADPEKHRQRCREWSERNRDKKLEIQREYNSRTRDDKLNYMRDRYLSNRDEIRAKNKISQKKWRDGNPEKLAEKQARYLATKRNATPVWANIKAITEIYKEAERRRKETGEMWHVDHIVPLISDIVCGLHWEENLQVLPAVENIKKSNRYWPDMP